jgi:DNA invertase Pin-like site-specific DNA recombinase
VKTQLGVAYIRASKDEQKLTPEAQRTQIERWTSHEGVRIVAWHVDQGFTGTDPPEKRPALLAALRDLQELRADLLVVARRDRLARRVDVANEIQQRVVNAGCRIASTVRGTDDDDPDNVFVTQLDDALAQREVAMIRKRTKDALAVKKSNGELTGKAPYGFRGVVRDPNRRNRYGRPIQHLEPDESEQKVIAFVQSLRETCSLREIVGKLNDAGFRSRAGTPFSHVQVAKMIGRSVS